MLKQQGILQEDNVTSSPGDEAEHTWKENTSEREGKSTIISRHPFSLVTGILRVLCITKS